jgi:hypothetical protein
LPDVDANEVGTPTDLTTTCYTAPATGTVVLGNGASGTIRRHYRRRPPFSTNGSRARCVF